MATEKHLLKFPPEARRRETRGLDISEAICEAVAHIAEDLKMRAIAVFTESGNTARLISKYRPRAPIFAFGHLPAIYNRVNLYWGVHPVIATANLSVRGMLELVDHTLLAGGILEHGDVVSVVAGTQSTTGSTNFVRLHRAGMDPREEARFRKMKSRRR